jgi:hypothetical protein
VILINQFHLPSLETMSYIVLCPMSYTVRNYSVPSQQSTPSSPVNYQLLKILFHGLCYVSYLTARNKHSFRIQQSLSASKYPTLYGTRSLTAMFIRSYHRSLLRARSIHSTHYLSQCNSNIIHPPATTSSNLRHLHVLWLKVLWISHGRAKHSGHFIFGEKCLLR